MPKRPKLDLKKYTRTQVILPDFDVALERAKEAGILCFPKKVENVYGIEREFWNKLNKKIILVKEKSSSVSIACAFKPELHFEIDTLNVPYEVFTKAQFTALKKYLEKEN